MKWLAYVGWFVVWFFIHSFIFVPIIKTSENALVDGLAAAINLAILVGGFIFISRQFRKQEST